MKVADVRAGDFVVLPNSDAVEIVRICHSDGDDEGLGEITFVYRSYHEWSWEASKSLAARGVKGPRLIAHPAGLDKTMVPLRPDDQVEVVRGPS